MLNLIVPTLGMRMPHVTLRVQCLATQSVGRCIPKQSVGTIDLR